MLERKLFPDDDVDLMTIKEASVWASTYIQKNVTPSNISYLVQYGKVKRIERGRGTFVSKRELTVYYDTFFDNRQANWRDKLGEDLNWHLSFEQLKEADTTKHVHRLHPYKGKFIPQLVEYFLDEHTDEFKGEVFFRKNDVVLDPFSGSGTTLVQANELGLNAIGIDVSAFNALIGNVKVTQLNLSIALAELTNITQQLRQFLLGSQTQAFDKELSNELLAFNAKYFPSPEFKRKLIEKTVDELTYSSKHLPLFLPIYERLVRKHGVKLKQNASATFLDKWYLQPIRQEIDFIVRGVKKIQDIDVRNLASVILSRTIRSCRATTHADLATLKEPVMEPYYCAKHGKLCKPLFSIQSRWETYAKDTIARITEFDRLRTTTYQRVLTGDARTIDVLEGLERECISLADITRKKKISGVFSSPPYVGLIDYHEQHAYAYDLFGFERKDGNEIGRLFHGQGRAARENYLAGIAEVLRNCKRFLAQDFNVFLVANDKYNLYPEISERAGMRIVNVFKRPVLNRTERDKAAYSETIFHLRGK